MQRIPEIFGPAVTEKTSVVFTIVEDATGRVTAQGDMPSYEMARSQAQEGQVCILDDPAPDLDRYYRRLAEWVEIEHKPTRFHVYDWTAHAWSDPRELQAFKDQQNVVVNQAFDLAAAQLTAGYPLLEQSTWPMQRAEALAWQLDPKAATPYLDGIAAVRGIDPGDMRVKTLENVQLFMAASQQLMGTRQRLRDAILKAASPEAVVAIVWPAEETAAEAGEA